MESPILNRIAEFLQEQKTHKRWRVVFVIMAVFVGVGTVTALRMMGLAMTHKERALDCQLELHKHDKSCYDSDKNLICGYADYVVHKHNDDCYNADLKLVCKLPEVEKHEHTKACYDRVAALVCGQEEAAGHEHTDKCYTTQKGDLKCKEPEHQHDDGCYDEEGNLTCGMEEHQHDDDCYKWDDVLNCGVKEGEGGHEHTDKCYEIQEGLICGQLEMHTHTDKCFEKIDKKGKDEPENLRLICGEIQLEEHVHTEAAGCLKTVEVDPDAEIAQIPEDDEDTADDSSDGSEIFTTDLDGEGTDGEAAEGEDGKDGEGAEGEDGENPDGEAAEGEETEDGETVEDAGTGEGTDGEAIDAEPEDYEFSKTYEGLGYIITAAYNEDANIPEEAKLVAEQITEESDKENYKTHEEEFKKNMGEEEATLSALFKIGFYVDGEEVEPESPVLVTIQFVDKNGLPEGAPVKVVHFGDEGTEVIDGSNASGGSTSFRTNGFSIFGVGVSKEAEKAKEESIHVSESYVYEDEVIRATFRVEGMAKPLEQTPEETGTPKDNSKKNDTASEEDKTELSTETKSAESEGTEEENGSENEAEGAEAEENGTTEESTTDSEDTKVTENKSEESAEDTKLELRIEKLDADSEEYKKVVEEAENTNDGSDLLSVQALSYAMYYGDTKMDISECKVTVEVEPAQSLSKSVKKSVPKTISKLRSLGGISEESENAANDNAQKELVLTLQGMMPGADTPDMASNMYLSQSKSASVMSADITTYTDDEGGSAIITAETTANPRFTVQYYAWLDVVSGTGANALPIIDTSDGLLPQNGTGTATSPNSNPIKNIYVDGDGNVQTEKKLTRVYTPRPYTYLKAPTLNYFNALVENPNYELKEVWIYQKHIHTDDCYETKTEDGKEVVKLKCKENDSLDKDVDKDVDKDEKEKVWKKVEYSDKLHFSNREVKQEDKEQGHTYIEISRDATIRLVYKMSEAKPDFAAAFYDYDISNGSIYADVNNAIAGKATDEGKTSNQKDNTLSYAYTKEAGINSAGNYTGTGTRLAFGNVNTGTTQGQNLWSGNLLNKYNGTQSGHPTVVGSYKGCTFGLVSREVDGQIQYSSGVTAPKLFNEGEAAGKTAYDNGQYSLKFNRAGDTYTLSAVNNTGVTGLESFGHPSPYTGQIHTGIWTNDFWPMDSAASYGADGHDLKFGSYAQRENRAYAGSSTAGEPGSTSKKNYTFPYSDDGKDHNSYFGMKYEVEFDLTRDYVGPLEYYFFGDDDMWVFLDGELVCDIGGIHSSVGEYVNLWNYLHKHDSSCYDENGKLTCTNGSTHVHDDEKCYSLDKNGNKVLTCRQNVHKLSFYYTERGASGSTCWMQFTLPSASSLTPQKTQNDYGHLKIGKTVKVIEGDVESDYEESEDVFEFEVKFTNMSGKNLIDDYRYTKYNSDGTEDEGGSGLIVWKPIKDGVISNGTKFTLKHGQYILIEYLPVGTKYTVTEKNGGVLQADGTLAKGKYTYTTDIKVNGKENQKDLGEAADKNAAGDITSQNTDNVQYINKFRTYVLPKTGGSGLILYTMAGVLCILLGAGFMYTKKARERRV